MFIWQINGDGIFNSIRLGLHKRKGIFLDPIFRSIQPQKEKGKGLYSPCWEKIKGWGTHMKHRQIRMKTNAKSNLKPNKNIPQKQRADHKKKNPTIRQWKQRRKSLQFFFQRKKKEREETMVWMVNQQVGRGRSRIWGVALLCWLFIMLVTPKIPLSYRNHLYADMRNFVGNSSFTLCFVRNM